MFNLGFYPILCYRSLEIIKFKFDIKINCLDRTFTDFVFETWLILYNMRSKDNDSLKLLSLVIHF